MSGPLKKENTPFWGRIAKEIIRNEIDKDSPAKVKAYRDAAFRQLFHNIRHLQGEIYAMGCFFDSIAEKKCAFIRGATTKSEMTEILELSKSKYDGMKFPEGPYHVHEEEILLLSIASLQAPLRSEYVDRMMSLLKMLMPEAYEECFGNKKPAI